MGEREFLTRLPGGFRGWARISLIDRSKSWVKSQFKNRTVNRANTGDRKVGDSWVQYGHWRLEANVVSPSDAGCYRLRSLYFFRFFGLKEASSEPLTGCGQTYSSC